jgi:hypothetical protein
MVSTVPEAPSVNVALVASRVAIVPSWSANLPG